MIRPFLWAAYAECVGGGERSLLELVGGLVRRGHRPVLGVPAEGALAEAARAAGIAVRIAPAPRFDRSRPFASASACRAARAALRSAVADCDLLHLGTTRQIPFVLGCGLPWIVHLRVASRDPYLDPFLPLADAVIANSRATGRRAHHARRLFIVPNGLPEDWFVSPETRPDLRAAARERFGIPDDAVVVALVGRATPEKGFQDLAPALRRLVGTRPSLWVLAAGDFETEEGRAVRQSLPERAVFAGVLDDPKPAYDAADLVVVPSRVEGFGRTALEAMARGVPVAVRKTGGLPEVVGDSGAHLPEPPARWADAIGALLSDPARREALSAAGLRRAREFPIERTVEGVLAAYEEVLSSRRRPVRPAGRPNGRLRILFVTNDYPPVLGGMAEYARGFAEGLAARGHEVRVLARDIAEVPSTGSASGSVEVVRRFLPVRSLARGGPIGEAAALSRFLREELERLRPDIVWVLTWPGWGVAARRAGVPYVVSAHGADVLAARLRPWDRATARWVFAGARAVLANSRFTAGLVRAVAPSARTVVLYPGVDVARFATPPDGAVLRALDARWGLAGKRVVGTVGALVLRKGQDTLLRAVAMLSDDYPDLVGVFVGGWRYAHPVERDLKELAARLSIIERTRFVGEASAEEVVAWMHRFDCFAMPGRIVPEKGWVEGFGIAYLEAGAAGKPVVGTTAGGAPEAIGDAGILVPPDDPKALARAIARVLSDSDEAARRAAAARARAEAFAWPRRAEEADRIVSTILGAKVKKSKPGTDFYSPISS